MKLFIVATPIGNLQDISARAIEVLSSVDLIASEDTRHSATLLQHLGINTPLIAYHDHNERETSAGLIAQVKNGKQIALISDAGTPLISDPGYRLVQLAHEEGVTVVPIPGASAVIAGLSASGLATDRFLFIGFLSAKKEARIRALRELENESATIVFYESRHRIEASVSDMVDTLGGERLASIGRELTKKFEQISHGTLAQLLSLIQTGDITSRGEFVVMVSGNQAVSTNYDHVKLMQDLLAELPPRKAAGVASQITGEPKKMFYDIGLQLKNDKRDS